MTPTERTAVLNAIAEAVLQCPQLKADPRLTLGQRHNAAKQVRAMVARKLAQKPEPAVETTA